MTVVPRQYYCLGTDEDIKTKFCDDDFIKRTKESHNLQCESLETEEAEYFSKLYGLTRKIVMMCYAESRDQEF